MEKAALFWETIQWRFLNFHPNTYRTKPLPYNYARSTAHLKNNVGDVVSLVSQHANGLLHLAARRRNSQHFWRKQQLPKNQVSEFTTNDWKRIYIFELLFAQVFVYFYMIKIVCHDARLETKYDGDLIQWELGPCKSAHVFESYKSYIQRCCLPPGTHILTCFNTEKDEGWKSASLTYRGHVYCDDFMSYKAMSHVQVKGNVHPFWCIKNW